MIDTTSTFRFAGTKSATVNSPIGLEFKTPDRQSYTFVPTSILEKGIVENDKQYYSPYLLSVYDEATKNTVDLNNLNFRGSPSQRQTDEDARQEVIARAQQLGLGTEGVLVPTYKLDEEGRIATENGQITQSVDNWRGYQIGETSPEGFVFGPILGTVSEGGGVRYNVQGGGQPGAYARADAGGVSGTYEIPGEKWYNTPLGKALIITGIVATGGALAGAGGAAGAGAAGGAAGGTGLTIGAGGATGLTAGATGATGLLAPSGFVLAPSIGAGVAAGTAAAGSSGSSSGLLDTAQFGQTGQTGITPGAAGQGLQTPTTPGLSSMGGGTGVTVPVSGGTVSQLGMVPTGATPVLGDPASFINDPNVLGNTVFTTDSLLAPGAATGPSVTDTLQNLNRLRGLLGAGQNPLIPQQQGLPQSGRGSQGVDYSGLLSLLQLQAGTPDVSGYTAPAQLRQMYQPTLLPNVLSLLG